MISIDNSTVHMAGALGVPVWNMIPFSPDWRWQMRSEETCWYPSMRLFRQRRSGDYDEIFSRIASEVAALVANKSSSTALAVPVAPGELLDKITILRIKVARIQDAAKLANVKRELSLLEQTWKDSGAAVQDVALDERALENVNERLWDIEDRIRDKEARQTFDREFIELARAVYVSNDERACMSRGIVRRTKHCLRLLTIAGASRIAQHALDR